MQNFADKRQISRRTQNRFLKKYINSSLYYQYGQIAKPVIYEIARVGFK